MTVTFTLLFALMAGLLLAAIPHLAWLLTLGVGRLLHLAPTYAPFGWSAVALVGLAWILIAWGFFVGRFRLEVTPVRYAHPCLPASFEGYRVVHISDLHLSTFADRPQALRRIVDSINAQRPDLVCFTGDLVTMGIAEADGLVETLRAIQAPDGVVSVMGNHDLLIYSRQYATDQQRLQAVEQVAALERDTLGWKLLRNQRLTLSRGADTIHILGVDNINGKGQGFHTIDAGSLPAAMAGLPDGAFSMLLSHDPSHWAAEVQGTPIALTLSGHTHAAQIRLFGWSPASWMFRHYDGRYDHQGQTLYVNPGLGCTLPVRLGCPAQITLLTLHQK